MKKKFLGCKSSTKSKNIQLEKNKIRKLNPDIFNFNINDIFIYQCTYSSFYFRKLEDKNIMKLDANELAFIHKIILDNKNENDDIFVLPFFKTLMENAQKNNLALDDRDIVINTLIKSLPKSQSISIQKVTEKFNEIANSYDLQKIKKSTMHSIMRKRLHMHFKKITVKNDKLLRTDYIKFSFFFIKIISRALFLWLKLVFIDESGFRLKNSHYKTWVFDKEQIYSKNYNEKKINLILAVSKDDILHYQIIKENTNSEIFINFMNKLIDKLKEKKIENFLFILDNFSGHLTLQLFKFYREKKIKILFSVPYASNFNMVENVFRLIKNITYKKLYDDIELLTKDIINIINLDTTINSLNRLFSETLGEYISFIEKNRLINLNLDN